MQKLALVPCTKTTKFPKQIPVPMVPVESVNIGVNM